MPAQHDDTLKFAEKYNWWTRDTSSISLETKLGYILQKGSSEELFFVFHNYDRDLIKKAYNLVKNDYYGLKPRRKYAIESLLKAKK